MLRCFIALILLTCLVVPADAQDANWQVVGTLSLQPNLKQDSLDLSAVPGEITAVRLKAKSGAVKITRVALIKGDGKPVYEDRTFNLKAGEQTRPILTSRAVGRSLNVRYTISGKEPAVIEVYATVDPATVGNLESAPPPKRTTRGRHHYSAPRPGTKSGASAGSDCVKENTCTPVNVYFGTTRAVLGEDDKPTDSREAPYVHFAADRSQALTLGRATVTVPRAFRKAGEIPLPSWWDVLKFRNPWKVDPARHFTVQTDLTTFYASDRDYVTALKSAMAEPGNSKDHVFIFVHGYNVTFDNALFRAAQISYDLGENDQPFGTALLFSWASSGATEDYAYDLDSANQAARHLKAYVKLVTNDLKPKHVHLIAHSMGNGPLLQALEEIAQEGGGTAKIDSVILAAPDVDAVEFQRVVANILPVSKTFTLYASANDRALLVSTRIRRGTPRAGDVPAAGPVIVNGLDSLDVSAVSTDFLALNHSDYADKKELLNDMWRLVRGERPPDKRNTAFHINGVAPSIFWRFVRPSP